MFRPKIAKSQQPAKTPYTEYYPHSISSEYRDWNQGYYQILSIDPAGRGCKNLGIRIERRPGPNDSGFITSELFETVTLVDSSLTDSSSTCNLYDTLTNYLDSHTDLFQQTHIIIIERQLPENYWGIRISQHIISYFLVKLKDAPLLPMILEIDPRLKGKQLGIPSGLGKKEYKNRLIEKARDLLSIRGDTFSSKILDRYKKKDDIADTVCQIEAVFLYFKWPPTQPRLLLSCKSTSLQASSESSDPLEKGKQLLSCKSTSLQASSENSDPVEKGKQLLSCKSTSLQASSESSDPLEKGKQLLASLSSKPSISFSHTSDDSTIKIIA